MAIYFEPGAPTTILRYATLDDLRREFPGKPENLLRVYQDNLACVVGRTAAVAEQVYYWQALRADGGRREVRETLQALSIARAVQFLPQCRVDPTDPAGWIYHDDETDAPWRVTRASMILLGELLARGGDPAAISGWEANDRLAVDRREEE